MANINETTGLPDDGFGFGTYEHNDRNFPGVVLPDGTVIDLSRQFADTHAILDDWDTGYKALTQAAEKAEGEFAFDDVRPLPPVRHPNVMQAGANYRRHVIEMMAKAGFGRREGESAADRRKRAEAAMAVRETTDPFVFVGLASSMAGAYDDVVLPVLGKKHDWELELTAVIGKTGRHVAPEKAHQLIAGYTISNDLGTHDYGWRTDAGPMNMDFLVKSHPTFQPTGPFIVPREFVDLTDPAMRIKLDVNGEKRQDEELSDMIFSAERIVSYLSSRVNLIPGDLVLTGSPLGNAASFPDGWLKDGDVIDASITYLGRQRNPCRLEQTDVKVSDITNLPAA